VYIADAKAPPLSPDFAASTRSVAEKEKLHWHQYRMSNLREWRGGASARTGQSSYFWLKQKRGSLVRRNKWECKTCMYLALLLVIVNKLYLWKFRIIHTKLGDVAAKNGRQKPNHRKKSNRRRIKVEAVEE
jgi:hypothetical protein